MNPPEDKLLEDHAPRPDLPREKHASRSKTTLLATLAGVLMCVLLANHATRVYLREHPENRGYWLLHSKWELLRETDGDATWLFLGDSSCNQGLDPAIWEEETGERALNLCTIGNVTAVNDAWMLQRYIELHGPPKAVIVSHVYDIWKRRVVRALLGQIPEPWGFWKELEPNLRLSSRAAWEIWLSRYVPLYSQNESSSATLRAIIAGELDPFEPTSFVMTDAGFMPWNRPNPSRVRSDAGGHRRSVRKYPFHVTSQNEQALEQIRRLADEHQIDVYVVSSPMYAGMFRDRKIRRRLKEVETMLTQWTSTSPRLHFVRGIERFSANEMQNADHVLEAAAAQFTRRTARKISKLRD